MSNKEKLLCNKFRLLNKIGEGSFGQIYEGLNINTSESVAIKLEPVQSKHPQLLLESKILKIMEGGLGLPDLYWAGTEGGFNAMVISKLGPSIEDLFIYSSRKLSLKTTLMIADQMLLRIHYVHSKDFIHRDIKPENFLIGSDKRCSILYIIDFGLSKRYKTSEGKHIQKREGKSLIGTSRYVSCNTHKGIEQSRRDDLESVAYVLIYLLKGVLPWQGVNAKTREDKFKLIMERKIATKTEELCKGLPVQIKEFLDYTRQLRFQDSPDYKYCRGLFRTCFNEQGFVYDYIFDWNLLNHEAVKMQNVMIEESNEDKEEVKAEDEINKEGESFKRAVNNENQEVGREIAEENPREGEKPKKSCILF